MELARGETPGSLGGDLLTSAFSALFTGPPMGLPLLESLASNFLGLADVRFFVLRLVKRVGEENPRGGGSAKKGGAAAAAGATGLAQNVFATLSRVPAVLEAGDELSSWCQAAEVTLALT